MKYVIKIVDEMELNHGHRMVIEGLRHDYGDPNYRGLDPKDVSPNFEVIITKYDYDDTVPPFWGAGICEQRCFTLPWAVHREVYDLVQVHAGIHNGDEFVFEYEGRTYVTAVNDAWPRCDDAQDAEKAFRTAHNIATKKE